MALIDIEYGSLASSEIMNKNFLYLDDKIAETSNSIMTSISSIYSNIATINARLSDIAEQIQDSVSEINTKQEDSKSKFSDYKNKVQLAVNNLAMLPDWSKCVSIGSLNNYTVVSNGYVLILPSTTSYGDLRVNGTTVSFKYRQNSNDNAAQLSVIPVKTGDVITCTAALFAAYFLPILQITIETE